MPSLRLDDDQTIQAIGILADVLDRFSGVTSLECTLVSKALRQVQQTRSQIGMDFASRAFATLDHLSGGRAGCNIVTSGSEPEARNFGLDRHYEHAERYRRAAEHVDVATQLWDSWEDGALVADQASGVYADTGRVQRAHCARRVLCTSALIARAIV